MLISAHAQWFPSYEFRAQLKYLRLFHNDRNKCVLSVVLLCGCTAVVFLYIQEWYFLTHTPCRWLLNRIELVWHNQTTCVILMKLSTLQCVLHNQVLSVQLPMYDFWMHFSMVCSFVSSVVMNLWMIATSQAISYKLIWMVLQPLCSWHRRTEQQSCPRLP